MAACSVTHDWYYPVYKPFDTANVWIGEERKPQRTEESDVRLRASVCTAVHGNVTLGVAVFLAKADLRAMCQRAQLPLPGNLCSRFF